jgi:ubiquinone biosynthesis protein
MIKKIGVIGKIYRHSSRYYEILEVITSHGFAEVISKLKLNNYINFGKKLVFRQENDKTDEYSIYERIRMILEKLGPTFIKLGQVMSSRSDLIPVEMIKELEKLHDSVEPFSSEEAKKQIEHELNESIDKLFFEFDMTPLAGASISQVHRAVLFDGSDVVVKVQRPNIKEKIDVDLEIMFHFATIAEKQSEEMRSLNLISIVEEFSKEIKKELDFSNEMLNIEKFSYNFQKNQNIYIPQYYDALSSKKILTLEYIDGIKVSDIKKLDEKGLSPKIIADNGVDAILKQIFEHGFFHADPHAGNIFILENNVISFVDFGMMGSLNDEIREAFESIIIGIANEDTRKVASSLIELSVDNDEIDILQVEIKVKEMLNKHFYRSLKNLDMVAVTNDMFALFTVNKLKMPPDFHLLARAVMLAQSFGNNLDPDFDISDHIKRYTKKIIQNRLKPKKLAKKLSGFGNEFWDLAINFPGDAHYIIKKIKQGKFKVDIEHKGLEDMLTTHERISNKIAFSVVLASIIVGSSLIILSGIPPLFCDIPVIGLLGFLGAVILGFWLIISIMKHGKI